MTLHADVRVRLSPTTLFRELDGEAVLLSLEGGRYYGLDSVGTRILSLLLEERTLGEVHALVLAEYEVVANRLWEDLVRLVGELQAEGLVILNDPEDATAR